MKKGDNVNLEGECLPYRVMAISNRFAVVSRHFDRQEDYELLEWEVKRGAQTDIDSAFENCKDLPVYSLLDLQQKLRSTDNLVFGIYDYFSETDCEECLKGLENGTVELSHRGITDFSLQNA
jgi:hypothetical protein